MKKKINVAIIGNGKAASDCTSLLRNSGAINSEREFDVKCLITDTTNTGIGSDHKTICESLGIVNLKTNDINDDETTSYLMEQDLQYIFSANNHQIIREKLLDIPTNGTINFHNAPLPRYRGLNACTWALVNGESEHGVTWHFVDDRVDSGDIIGQSIFPIDDEITAIGLVFRCIEEGTQLFEKLLPQFLDGNIDRIKQDPSKGFGYKKGDKPNGGVIDFTWNYDVLNNFIRGLYYYPFHNQVALPQSECNGRIFYVDKIEYTEDNKKEKPGKIVVVDNDRVCVSIADANVQLKEVRNQEKTLITTSEFVKEYSLEEGKYIGQSRSFGQFIPFSPRHEKEVVIAKSDTFQVVEARVEHVSFIAWVVLTAERSHLKKGFWDFMLEEEHEAGKLNYLKSLATAEQLHWGHYSQFIVAEVNQTPVAALCGYFEEELGGLALQMALVEANLNTGREDQHAKTGAVRAKSVMNVIPDHISGAWIIENVAIRPEFRSRGLVDLLMDEILKRGQRRGASTAYVKVLIGNDIAQRVYERHGFAVVTENLDAEFESVYKSPGIRLLRREI